MAPEVFNNKGYSSKIDIFSLGCVVFNLMMKEEKQVYTHVLQNTFPSIRSELTHDRKYSHSLVDILFKMLCLNPDKRIAADQLHFEIGIYNEELKSQILLKDLGYDIFITIFSYLHFRNVLQVITVLNKKFHSALEERSSHLWKELYEGKFYYHLSEEDYTKFLGSGVPKSMKKPSSANTRMEEEGEEEEDFVFSWKENFKRRYLIHKKYIKGNVQKDHNISVSLNVLKAATSPITLSPTSVSPSSSSTPILNSQFLEQVREKKFALLQSIGQILFSINCPEKEERMQLIVYSYEIFEFLVSVTEKRLPIEHTKLNNDLIESPDLGKNKCKNEEHSFTDPKIKEKKKLLSSLYQKMAVIASKLRRFSRAIEKIKKAIHYNPMNVHYRYYMIKFYRNHISDKGHFTMKTGRKRLPKDNNDAPEEEEDEIVLFKHETFQLISQQFEILLQLDEENETFLWEYAEHLTFYADKLYSFYEYYCSIVLNKGGEVDFGKIFTQIQGCYDKGIELLKRAIELYPQDMSAMRKIESYLLLKFQIFKKWYSRIQEYLAKSRGVEEYFLTTLNEDIFEYFDMCIKINKYHHEAFMTLCLYLVEKMDFLFFNTKNVTECYEFCESNISLLLPHIQKFDYLKQSESQKYDRLMNCVSIMTMVQIQCILKKQASTDSKNLEERKWDRELEEKKKRCLKYLNMCVIEKSKVYNIACLYSILKDEANCKKVFLAGLKKYYNQHPFTHRKMSKDPDLDFLRTFQWFQLIMETLKKKEELKKDVE